MKNNLKILFIFGTRPETIKLAPVIKEFKKEKYFNVKICFTGQHNEMVNQVLDFFQIKPHYRLDVMKENQSLFELTSRVLKGLKNVLEKEKPSLVFVQGDTTTAFVGALGAFYMKIQVGHIESGLRSFNKYFPFPEEINRVLISRLSDYHFAPTEKAKENLYKEGIKENVWVVGNTVIDALVLVLDIIKRQGEENYYKYFDFIDFSKKIILVTAHRRESFGKPFENICYALKEIAKKYEDVEIVYPVHLNPNVRAPVFRISKGIKNIHLIDPLIYPHLIWLMSKTYLILTDSGGIQEEAPSLGKPVLVMRNVTERTEGMEAGTAKLVGTDRKKIVKEVSNLLIKSDEYKKMVKVTNPYGDGKASKRILSKVIDLLR